MAELAGDTDPTALVDAARAGVPNALEDLGRAFVEGRATPSREGQAFEAINALIDATDPVAEPELYRAALRAIADLHADRAARSRFARNHYTLRHVETLIELGETDYALRLYEWSDGDIDGYLPGAARAGNLEAQLLLARLADRGQGRAAEGAMRWYRMAAENGSAEAARRLAQIEREMQVETAVAEEEDLRWMYLGLPANFPNADALRSAPSVCVWENWTFDNSGISALARDWPEVRGFASSDVTAALNVAGSGQGMCTILGLHNTLLAQRSDINDLAFSLGLADLTDALLALNNPARPDTVAAPSITADARASTVRELIRRNCSGNMIHREAILCDCLAEVAFNDLADGAHFFPDSEAAQTIASQYTAGEIPAQCINEPALRTRLDTFARGLFRPGEPVVEPFVACVLDRGMAFFNARPTVQQLGGRSNSFLIQASTACNHLRGIGTAPAEPASAGPATGTTSAPPVWAYFAIPEPDRPSRSFEAYSNPARAVLCVTEGWAPSDADAVVLERRQVANSFGDGLGSALSTLSIAALGRDRNSCNIVVLSRDLIASEGSLQRAVQRYGLVDVTADFSTAR